MVVVIVCLAIGCAEPIFTRPTVIVLVGRRLGLVTSSQYFNPLLLFMFKNEYLVKDDDFNELVTYESQE